MASPEQPRNRKERRAAERKGKAAGSSSKPKTMDDIILEQPNRTRPDGKTLFQLADERQAELDRANGRPTTVKIPMENEKDGDWEFMSDDPLGAGGDAVLYGVSLTMLHFTLDVLVYNQYRQEIVWKEIWTRTGIVLPILMLLVYMLHPTPKNRYLLIGKQLFFLVASVVAGCYLVKSGNKWGYYAVMKRAPPLGTLWVWSVIEMQLGFALPGLAIVVGYTWYYGYGLF